jgi:hypothetical protein
MNIHRLHIIIALALFTALASIPAAMADSPPRVFDLPAIQSKYMTFQVRIAGLMQSGKYEEAEKICREALALVPHDPQNQFNLARALARQGRLDEAIRMLEKSVSLGFNDAKQMAADPHLAALKGREDFRAILEKAPSAKPDPKMGWTFSVKPAIAGNGIVKVTEENTLWDPRLGVFRSFFAFPGQSSQPVAVDLGEAGDLLRLWAREGTAAGNHGDLYDNHDSGHSNMAYGAFPQLTRIEFSEAAKSKHLHYGLQLAFLFDRPTLGNSSTAQVAGPFWRSQPRSALMQPGGPQRLYLQYVGNHLYFYPEHRDYKAGHSGADGKGYGDLYPANTPYIIISQGSSGTDKPFMTAFCATMAAFRPEVKAELVRSGTLMPALQMIFRQSNKMVRTPEDYFTGKAHPTVFDGTQIDMVRMVRMAHDMTVDTLPPMVQLHVIEEDHGRLGVDYFDAAEREKLFDTPCAIARIMRSTRHTRRIVVSAERSRDLKSRPLRFEWVVLRGDPALIRINRLNAEGTTAEITISHHPRRPIQPGAALESNRVDIGVFARSDHRVSAPGFLSFYFLDNEKRIYDGEQRIRVVDYADPQTGKNYVDPLLDSAKDWRDEYTYDAAGRMTGWMRVRGLARERYTADGARVTKTDGHGRPVEAKRVRYTVSHGKDQRPVLLEEVTESIVRYPYDSLEDQVGRPIHSGD